MIEVLLLMGVGLLLIGMAALLDSLRRIERAQDRLGGQLGYLVEREQIRAGVPPENL